MAPTLFSIMFSVMLADAFQDVDAGFPIRYRFDGKLLNLRRLQAKSKVQTDVVDKLLYADDLAEKKNKKKMLKFYGVLYTPTYIFGYTLKSVIADPKMLLLNSY